MICHQAKLGKVLSTTAQIPHLLLLDSHTSIFMTFYPFTLFPRNKNGVTFFTPPTINISGGRQLPAGYNGLLT
jgi:hypothetical protein